VTVRSEPQRVDTFPRGDLVFDVIDTGPIGGEAVILLHGFPADATSWTAVARRLHRRGYRTLAPHQRGYSPAARPQPLDAYRIDELVLDVLCLADRAGLRRFHLIGHDWGGCVAWHLAARHGLRLHSLTVLSTPHPRAFAASLVRSGQLLRSWYAVAWQVPALPEWAMRAARGTVFRRGLEACGLPARLADSYTRRMLEPGALTAALNWYRAAGRRPGDVLDLSIVTTPTLYAWSTRDPAIGRSAAQRTAHHVAAPYRFEVLDGVSHWIPETAADTVADLFISDRASRRVG
jgi:pimeloyl-ACP methyl ester carboxylesterase